MEIPTLDTPRLILRAFREGDSGPLAAIHAREEVARFVLKGGVPQPDPADAFHYIAASLGHWTLKGCGRFAVEEKASGRLVGRCGFNDFPYDWPGLELGWTFHPDVWGSGYATEAAEAALRWGFEAFGAPRIIHLIDPENVRSQAVARRLGASPGEPWSGRGIAAVIWTQTREAWAARRA